MTGPAAARPRRGRETPPLEALLRESGDRVGQFVRSIQTLSAIGGNLGETATESNLRLARTAFGKWAVDLLAALHPHRRAGFGELRRHLAGISPRVLSAKLKLLEQSGLIERTIIPSHPPRPEYALTDRGRAVTTIGEPVLRYLKSQPRSTTRPANRRRSASR